MADRSTVITVSCPDHHQKLANGLWNLLHSNHGLDSELRCGERSAKAHGVVLQVFLSTDNIVVSVQKDFEVADTLPPTSDNILEFVLEFLYKGSVTVKAEQLDDLQATAKQLDLQLLVDAVEESKQCNPLKIAITGVAETPPEVPGRKRYSTKRLTRKNVDSRKAEAAKKSKRCNLAVDEDFGSGGDESDSSGSSEWQPDLLENDSGTDDKPATSGQLKGSVVITKRKKRSVAVAAGKREPKKPGLLNCNFCEERFKSEEVLEEHMTIHRMLKCTMCDFETASRTDLSQHQNHVHYIDNKGNPLTLLKCPDCDYATLILACFRRHRRLKHLVSKTVSDTAYKPSTVTRRKRQTGSKQSKSKQNAVIHKCDHCDYVGPDRTRLTFHVAKMHDPSISVFRCTVCSRKFVTEAGLKLHMDVSHLAEFSCPHCDFKTLAKIPFQLHLGKHEPEKAELHRCKFCSRFFKSAEALEEHKANHETLQCTLCKYTTKNRSTLRAHCLKHETVKAELLHCKLCPKTFKASEDLEEHLANHEILKCTMCEYTTKVRSSLWRHKVAKHPCLKSPDGIPHLSCPFCRRTFKSTDVLEKHMTDHEIYKCTLCDYETKTRGHLYQHRGDAHSIYSSGKARPTFNCSECQFTTVKPSVLKRHTLTLHSGLKPYKCPYCTFATAWKAEVNRHINITHLDRRPHACEICDFRAIYPAMLEQHMFTHTGQKPYKCDSCEAAFSSKKGLKNHLLDHSTEPRPHVCHLCGRAFKRGDHLSSHMKNLHKKDRD